jgi:hypothetical protein
VACDRPRLGVATSVVPAPRALGLTLTAAVMLTLAGLVGAGCAKSSCLTGDDEACVVVPPCTSLAFTCTTGRARAYVLGPTDPIPPGLDTLASPGDVVLESDQVVAVIDALDHPHHLAPSGGMLLDLARAGGEDALNQALVATGLLPGDTAQYTSLELIETPTEHAVIVRGHLAGDPEHFIATRYEVRPCEPGLRIRSEVVHRGRDPRTWALTDGWFWGGRDLVPFVPLPHTGFEHPSFGLTTVDDVWRDADYLAAASLSSDLSSGTSSTSGPSSGGVIPGMGGATSEPGIDTSPIDEPQPVVAGAGIRSEASGRYGSICAVSACSSSGGWPPCALPPLLCVTPCIDTTRPSSSTRRWSALSSAACVRRKDQNTSAPPSAKPTSTSARATMAST